MLDFNYTLLVQFANILILLILLKVFLFKPVLNVLSKRRAYLQSLADKVAEETGQAGRIEKQYEEVLRERKQPILAAHEATVKDARAASMQVIEAARRELTSELDTMKERIKAEADAALQRLTPEADRLAHEVATRILGRTVR